MTLDMNAKILMQRFLYKDFDFSLVQKRLKWN